MLANNNLNTYKQQQILTASPEQLILMLYNGCIKFINEANKAIEEKDIEKANNSCVRAQDIIMELVANLNMEYPISGEFFILYEYSMHEVIQANLKKEASHLKNAKEVIVNLREGWMEAIKKMKEEGGFKHPQAGVDSAISI